MKLRKMVGAGGERRKKEMMQIQYLCMKSSKKCLIKKRDEMIFDKCGNDNLLSMIFRNTVISSEKEHIKSIQKKDKNYISK